MCAIAERVENTAKISRAITLGYEIRRHFVDGCVSAHAAVKPDRALARLVSPGIVTFRGHLNLTHQDIKTGAVAACSFSISLDWPARSPALRCEEKWIRGRTRSETRPSWHINADDSFCYVLDAEWADSILSVRQDYGWDAAVVVAGYYCVNNAKWLLYRHLEGYRRKLVEWPKDWPQWPHYGAGLQAYLAERAYRRKSKQ